MKATFTFGFLNVTPVRIVTEASLDEMVSGMADNAYSQSQGFGWCYLDPEDSDRPRVDSSAPGIPAMIQVTSQGIASAQVVLGRYLRDTANPGLAALPASDKSGISHEILYNQNLTDVMIVQKGPSELWAFVNTHNRDELDRCIERLKRCVPDANSWEIFYDLLPLSRLEEFYWWVATKYFEGAKITPVTHVDDLREIGAKSPAGPRMKTTDGVDGDSLYVLSAIAQGHALGPMKLDIYDKDLGVLADLHFVNTGTIGIHRSSKFDSGPLDGGPLGIRLVYVVCAVLLPKVVDAFASDESWTAAKKLKLKQDATTALRGAL